MPNMSDIPGEVATLITTLVADPTRRVFRITGTMCRASAYAEYDSDEGQDGTQLTTNCSAFSKLVEVTDNSGDALEELPAPALGAELLKTLLSDVTPPVTLWLRNWRAGGSQGRRECRIPTVGSVLEYRPSHTEVRFLSVTAVDRVA